LTNPLDKDIIFEVFYEGEGLSGEKILTLDPHQTYTYILLFTPLRPFKGQGSITFACEELGEIWYRLNLEA
jgi:hypothetical protein